MSDVTRRHSDTLARQFYQDHQSLFAAAAAEEKVSKQFFYIDSGDFDSWLVSAGCIPAAPGQFDSNTIESYGIVQQRNHARLNINRAAAKAQDFHAYTIGRNSNGKLKVRLLELYIEEAPDELKARMRTSSNRYQRQIEEIQKLAETSTYVTEEGKAGLRITAKVYLPLLKALDEAYTTSFTKEIDNDRRRQTKRITAAKKARARSRRRSRP